LRQDRVPRCCRRGESPRFRDEPLFRDYLRTHRDAADEYGELKRRLAKEFEQDREGYTAAKAEFIRGTVHRALHHLGAD
jgi:GrpB-like predicted nucleotidyltransferase (UPF0157 family)